MDVGAEIRRAREAKGWSQAKLAAGADMGVSGISQIETGTRNPSVVTLSKIAEALGVGVADLFPKAPSSSLEASFDDVLDDERRAAWEAAAAEGRRLRETGRGRMWEALSGWRASKQRGEPDAARRGYLDEMGSLLREVYDAEGALGLAFVEAAFTQGDSEAEVPSYLREESRTMGHFYGELFGLVRSVGLTVLTGADAAAAERGATAQPEARPSSVEESAA